jgi:hypothetical protein
MCEIPTLRFAKGWATRMSQAACSVESRREGMVITRPRDIPGASCLMTIKRKVNIRNSKALSARASGNITERTCLRTASGDCAYLSFSYVGFNVADRGFTSGPFHPARAGMYWNWGRCASRNSSFSSGLIGVAKAETETKIAKKIGPNIRTEH